MNTTFFHFTAKRFLESIQKEGLTRGCMLASMEPPKFIMNKQWLTTNPDFKQGWAQGTGKLPYSRTEVRLTIEIPVFYISNLKPWTQLKFLVPLVAKELEDSPDADPENWMIYQGRVNPEWIKEVIYKARLEEVHKNLSGFSYV